MSESDKEVILTKLEYIEKFIVRIELEIQGKCASCQNSPTFRERLRSQWTHILAIWSVIGAYFAYLVLRGK